MEFIPVLIVITLVACGWFLTRPKVLFSIRYRRGVPQVVRGSPAEGVLLSIDAICRQNGVTSGTISAVPAGNRVRMTFSAEIPQGCQQQIRNMMLSGSVDDIRLSPPR